LSDPAVAELFAAEPGVALSALGEPALIDEWTQAPQVLGAVKRAVDAAGGEGRFVLTGSVSDEDFQESWQATGRVIDVELGPMAAREVAGWADSDPFVVRALRPAADWLDAPPAQPGYRLNLADYISLVELGGFPQVVTAASADQRRQWLASYANQLVRLDARGSDGTVDPHRFKAYLRALALSSAASVGADTLTRAAGINRETARRYAALLNRLFIAQSLPPFFSNRLKRLAKTPKRVIADSGLMLSLAGLAGADLIRDSRMLGRALETFVVAQLRAELALVADAPTLCYLRDQNGDREVDLVLEYPDGKVVGIEVKTSLSSGPPAHRHLVWLRDQLGDRFQAGFVLHAGLAARSLEDRVFAAPISAIWAWDRSQAGAEILHLDQAGAHALGRLTAGRAFQVLAGSTGMARLTPSMAGDPVRAERIRKDRAALERNGVIRRNPGSDTFTFTRNWVFGSSSTPAEMLFGGQISGPNSWRTADGTALDGSPHPPAQT
jgi:predicted AAA+ superfamily ATPase